MNQHCEPADHKDLPISADERDRLLAPLAGSSLALCVSGGADSMALMYLVAEWAMAGRHKYLADFSQTGGSVLRRVRRPARLHSPDWLNRVTSREGLEASGGPVPIVVLTVDHGLRLEAAEEARFVAAEAAKLGFPHQTLKADETPPETGIQDWARNLRRRLILELLAAEAWRYCDFGLDDSGVIRRKVVMAHHLDDQAETVLMRLARGSGLVGLGGMDEWDRFRAKPKSEPNGSIEAVVVRPLLKVPKVRLLSTLKERGLNFVDDHSNSDDRFERVRVRKALKVLGELGVSAQAISKSAGRLRAANLSLSSFEESWHKETIELHNGLMASVASPRFARSGEFSEVRLLSVLLSAFGGAATPAELSQIERLREMLMGAEGPFTGATLGGCRIQLEGACECGRLLVYREGNGEGLETVQLGPGQSVDWDDRFRITSDPGAVGSVEVRALGADGWAGIKREVYGFDELKLKAAAMATLPAIWSGEEIVSVPFLDKMLILSAEIGTKQARAWAKWRCGESGFYKAEFLTTGVFSEN